jgi:hypothetical protein
MDIGSVYDWFARDCIRYAQETDNPRQREILLKLAVQWGGRRTTDPRRSIEAIDVVNDGSPP